MTHERIDHELQRFLFALVEQETVPADELQLSARLAAFDCAIDRTQLRTIIAFALACRYLERAGSHLVFTHMARKRVDALRARQAGAVTSQLMAE
jgi:hypothetical protein